ncbi:MAG: dihydrolipoyl dehydrogenase [Sulfurospirillum sp.]|nr:dihydrolipoyl dehydrogenase [Sulfurospirillum sp.]
MKEFDIIIIGGGRASNLALKAAKSGKKVALIERSKLGGTCPNRGCVPSKLLEGYAHVARSIKGANRHFIDASIQSIDLEKIFQETNGYIEKVDGRYETNLGKNVTIFRGVGSFESDHIVRVGDERLSSAIIVIATGTRPKKPEHKKAWSSDDIFPLLGKVPRSITIVGSGFIACELANFFDAVGVKTKVLVRSQKMLTQEDGTISGIFKEEFSKNIDISFDTIIQEVRYVDDKFLMTLKQKDGVTCEHSSNALLYATGRESNSDTLDLQNTTIQTDERGFIKRDAYMQTTVKGVYVIGDASGEHMLQHAAAYEANHLGKILFEGCAEPLAFKYMPHAVFTDPQVASVGITEEQAKKQGILYVATTTNWQASARAMALRINYPLTKFIINPQTYEILGCHMIGPESSSMIHQVLSVLHIDNDIRHLKQMLYIHPALNEALLPAAVASVQACEDWQQ